jgi:hypothetical protein
MRPINFYQSVLLVQAIILFPLNLFAQDIDTLDWDEIVELACNTPYFLYQKV